MGFFDIFKKKEKASTFPENEIEKVLIEASTKTSAQIDFYQKILWKDLILLTNEFNESEVGIKTLKTDTTVQFKTLESGHIPIFTSPNRIFDQGIIKEQTPYISIKGQHLFEIAKGAKFVLNPYTDYGKEILPDEIEKLLDGTIFDSIKSENERVDKFNNTYEKAIARQENLIIIGGYHTKPLDDLDKVNLEKSISEFEECLEISPDHWQCLFFMSKAYQRLENHTKALELLERAFNLESDNHSIPMEASLEAMNLGNIEKALFYSEESLKRKPYDYALMGNHAMNLLIACKDKQAKTVIDEAIILEPKDAINKNVQQIIYEVISKDRIRPTFKDAIK